MKCKLNIHPCVLVVRTQTRGVPRGVTRGPHLNHQGDDGQ